MVRSPKTRWLLFAVLVGTSFLLAAAVLTDWIPLLRGPAPGTSEWYWPYLLRPLQQLWPSAVAALLILILSYWWLSLRKPQRSQTIFALVTFFFLSLLLQASLIYADRSDVAAELVNRTLSNQASGFFEPAAEIEDISYVLTNFAQEMPRFVSEHARTHPPGMLLSNWATIQLFDRLEGAAQAIASRVTPLRCTDLWLLNRPAAVSAALGVWAALPLVFAAAVIWPAYALAGQLLHGISARLAAILAGIMPALILFAPKSVQLYAPLTLLLFWLFHSGLSTQQAWRLFLAGILLSLLTFFSLGNAALLLLLGLYALLLVVIVLRKEVPFTDEPKATWSRLGTGALAFGLGAALIWVAYALVWRAPPWEIAFTGLEQHYQLVTNLRRYEWWVGWNLVDLVLFSGWPLALGFGGSLILVMRRWRNGRMQAVDALAIALTIFVLVLNFSGTARGEVGRLWLFFMPLLVYPAAFFWSKALPGKWFATAVVPGMGLAAGARCDRRGRAPGAFNRPAGNGTQSRICR
jgi:methylthioxylose transferase